MIRKCLKLKTINQYINFHTDSEMFLAHFHRISYTHSFWDPTAKSQPPTLLSFITTLIFWYFKTRFVKTFFGIFIKPIVEVMVLWNRRPPTGNSEATERSETKGAHADIDHNIYR